MSEVVWRAVSAVEEADRLAVQRERRARKQKAALPPPPANHDRRPPYPELRPSEGKCLVIVSPSTMELLLRGRVASR